MTTRGRRTLIASASVLLVAIAAIAAVVTFASSPQSSPSGQGPANTRSSAGGTSTPSAGTSPAPGASAPSPTAPSVTPAPSVSTVVPASKPARVDVVTTFAGWNGLSHAVEVGGYAAVVEPVGTCTLTLSHGDLVVTRKHTARADATTVACGGFSIPRGDLSAGSWTAVLGYRSPTSAGEASAVSLTVP
ncbi:MAG: hypothetical protein ABI903_01310 [Actinomycetota bacterium]